MSLNKKIKQLSAFSIILLLLLPSSLSISINLPFGAVLSGGNDRFTFTGQEKDKTGLMYYGARYYDPFTMHFTQPDSILPDVYDPQQLNRYSYVRNNPVKYTDPEGHYIQALLQQAWNYLSMEVWPVLSPILGGVFAYENAETVKEAVDDPTPTNIVIGGLAVYDSATPGIPEGKIAKETPGLLKKRYNGIKNLATKASTKIKSIFKKENKVVTKIEDAIPKNVPDFYSTPNKQVVPSTTPGGREITPHAADRMANPPKGRIPMMPNEVDAIIDKNIIRKTNYQEGTITYWDPTFPGKPQVAISDDGSRIATVIKNKPR